MNNSELAQNIIGQFGDIVLHSMMCLIHFSYRGNTFYETHNKHMEIHAFSGGWEEQSGAGGWETKNGAELCEEICEL